MDIVLRPYQKETKDIIVEMHRQNPQGHAKFVWATALGKTVGFSAIADEIVQRTHTNVLIVAHREELLTQAEQKYHFINPDARIGKVGNGYAEWGLPVTVASIQTLARPNHLKNAMQFNFGLIIVDEVHHATSDNEYGKVLRAFPDAFKIGCTATDDRLDRKTNDDLFGESVFTMGILDGIEQGYLAPIKAIAIKTGVMLDGLHTHAGDYIAKELAGKVDTPERNRTIVEKYIEHASERQFMAFCIDIAHATHLADAFQAGGVKVAVVSGETPNRATILRDFEHGVYRGICNCQVFTEGYDAETTYEEDSGQYIFLSCAIMARPTKSRGLFTQCIGRILRLAPTKIDALVLDATDNVFTHGLAPQTLARVVGIDDLRDGETVLEAKKRKEIAEQKKRERRMDVQRDRDITLDLLAKLIWQTRPDGMFVMEVGSAKHRIALIPCKDTDDGLYRVAARLAPTFAFQWWSNEPLPLDWAQSVAEKKARKLLADPKAITLIDRNAPWRQRPVEPESPQVKMAKWHHLNWQACRTKGELADLIDARLSVNDAKKRKQEVAV